MTESLPSIIFQAIITLGLALGALFTMFYLLETAPLAAYGLPMEFWEDAKECDTLARNLEETELYYAIPKYPEQHQRLKAQGELYYDRILFKEDYKLIATFDSNSHTMQPIACLILTPKICKEHPEVCQ